MNNVWLVRKDFPTWSLLVGGPSPVVIGFSSPSAQRHRGLTADGLTIRADGKLASVRYRENRTLAAIGR